MTTESRDLDILTVPQYTTVQSFTGRVTRVIAKKIAEHVCSFVAVDDSGRQVEATVVADHATPKVGSCVRSCVLLCRGEAEGQMGLRDLFSAHDVVMNGYVVTPWTDEGKKWVLSLDGLKFEATWAPSEPATLQLLTRVMVLMSFTDDM